MITVADYSEQWRELQLHRDTTAAKVEGALRLHVTPLPLGRLALNAVKASHLQSWVKDRTKVLDASTVRSIFKMVNAMFAAATLDKLIGSNPCTGIRLPELLTHDDQFVPSAEQVHLIAGELPERYRAAVYVAAGCGLRFGEVFGLEPGHVAFLKREITVNQQANRIGKRGHYIGRVKTKTSHRTVELPRVVADAVAPHMEQFPPVAIIMDDDTGRTTVRRPVPLLFTTSRGTPVSSSSWSVVWRAAVKRTGLPAEGFTLHSLRHYFATLLIHNGASVKTVQLALGHASADITLRTYLHEWPDQIDRTRNLVDNALGDPGSARSAGSA